MAERILRHWTLHGMVAYDRKEQVLTSPLRPKDNRQVKVGWVLGTLIEAMMEKPDRVHPPEELLKRMWGYKPKPDQLNEIAPYIDSFRKKVGETKASWPYTTRGRNAHRIVHGIFGRGYTLVEPDAVMAINSYHQTTSEGEIAYDPTRLLAFSPLVGGGLTPIHIRPCEGKILPYLFQPDGISSAELDDKFDPVYKNVILCWLRKKFGEPNLIENNEGYFHFRR